MWPQSGTISTCKLYSFIFSIFWKKKQQQTTPPPTHYNYFLRPKLKKKLLKNKHQQTSIKTTFADILDLYTRANQ